MATLDIFTGDAFSLVEYSTALDRIPYKPQLLGQLGVFTPKPITTESFAVEGRDGVLSVIKSSPRGAPLEQQKKEHRNIRDFRTVRIAKGDRLNASEIQGIRAFGSSSEFEQAQASVMRKSVALRGDAELTLERHRFGAIQGVVLDADGEPLYNWFELWGISPPTEINFHLDVETTDVKKLCRDVGRAMQVASAGAWTPSTRIGALCGDNYYDALLNHKQTKESKLGTERAVLLDGIAGFSAIEIENITFINYRGTDDGSSIAIGTDKVKFFPIGATDVFQHMMSPGESFELVNTPGQPFYTMLVPDKDRDMYIDVEVYSYPAMVCTRPKMLLRGKRA